MATARIGREGPHLFRQRYTRRLSFEPLEHRRLLSTVDADPDEFSYTAEYNDEALSSAAGVSLAVGLPHVIGVTPLGAPTGNQIVVAVDFSEAMAPTPAEDVGNYRVALENGTELPVVDAGYADAADGHRATLTLAGDGLIAGGTYHLEVNGHNLMSVSGQAMSEARDDLAVHVYGDNSLAFVGQRADDTLGTLGDPLSLGWGVPEHLVSTDFDGDGMVDIVTTASDVDDDLYPEDFSVLIYFRGLGGGEFTGGTEIALAAPAEWVQTVDWNQDGNPDLAASGWEPNLQAPAISILLNDGHGNFSQAPETPVLNSGNNSTTAAFADFTGDGLIDIAVAGPGGWKDNAPGSIEILGKDPFLGYGTVDLLPLPPFKDQFPGIILTGDLNEDGKPEIVSGNSGVYWDEPEITVFLSSADGFGPAQVVPFQKTPLSPTGV